MATHILVIMGVSGSGKTTIGKQIAARLGWDFQEGDDFHPAANVAKMHDGIPLDDADRAPWLAAIADWMDERIAARESSVITCSALKRAYRDLLRGSRTEVWFVYLQVSHAELQRRVTTRRHRYMPSSLLDSQLATLQEPGPDEPHVLAIDSDGSVEATVQAALQRLRQTGIVAPGH
jgi:carbohydrate kinase (thermoresistant glucokinase family)